MNGPNRIVVVSVTKIESDILESFVRHSLTFADEILIADNGSCDGASEILRELCEEGMPLRVKKLPYQVEFDHAGIMLELVREAVEELYADIVLPLDIDEFLVNTENELTCKRVLQVLDRGKTYMLQMSVYTPLVPYEDSGKFLLDQECRREPLDTFRVGKVIIGAELVREESFRLLQGCHEAYWEKPDGKEGIPYEKVPFLHIAHFHWRSERRYTIKSVLGWIGMASQYTEYSFVCSYMRSSYEKIVRGKKRPPNLGNAGELIHLMDYCERQEMRYGTAAKLDGKAIVLQEFAHLAEAYAEEKAAAQRRKVDVLIPFWGDVDALCSSLDAALDQTYPHIQIHILKWAGAPPKGLEDLMRECPSVDYLDCENMDVDAIENALSQRATGEYIQWFLPGSSPEANQTKKLVAVLALQNDYRYVFPFAFATHPLPSGRELFPYMEVYQGEEAAFLCNKRQLWRRMLVQGEYPVNGMDHVIVLASVMHARKWMLDCFDEKGPRIFSMWRSLLRDMPQDGTTAAGYGIRDDVAYVRHVSKDEYIRHQMEWMEVLSEEGNVLSGEEIEQALSQMVKNYRQVLFSNASAGTELMHEYKECIHKLGLA